MGKNKTGIILIIVLLVVLLVLIGVGFTLLYKNINKPSSTDPNVAVVQEELPISDIVNFSAGTPITTNLMQGEDASSHVIKVGVSLGINQSKDVAKEAEELILLLTSKNEVVKDIIIGICRSKTFEELNRSDVSSILKEEMLVKFKETFNTELIVDVYIYDLFLQ